MEAMQEGDKSTQRDLKSSQKLYNETCKVAFESKEESHITNYVRADKINLAYMDAALECVNNKRKMVKHESLNKEEWVIDISKLSLKDVITRGTYGVVYKGIYDGQDVAVKLLDWEEGKTMTKSEIREAQIMFKNEISIWHKLDHPNVARFLGAFMGYGDLELPSKEHGVDSFVQIASNIYCVVVEYLAGGTVKNYLIKHIHKKLTFKKVMQLALDFSRGLNYLHSQSIMHRDVKTENMLLDGRMNLKIADFGTARVDAQNSKDLTGETGTLRYMAPEILAGKSYDRKCDVFSFGICLWEIYCCDMPYPELTFAEMTSAIVNKNMRPEIPRCCPSALATIMKKCWDANPSKRPTMQEVVHMLEAIDTSKGVGMTSDGEAGHGCPCFKIF